MAGNSFGVLFRITTFGESHGKGIGVVIDGCPPGIGLSPEDFEHEMARRRPGARASDTPRKEEDQVEILSGVFEGLTTGAPVSLFVHNRDVKSVDRIYHLHNVIFDFRINNFDTRSNPRIWFILFHFRHL